MPLYIGDKLGDIRRLVADTLQIIDHLERGGYFPKIARHRLLAQQQAKALGLDIPLHLL